MKVKVKQIRIIYQLVETYKKLIGQILMSINEKVYRSIDKQKLIKSESQILKDQQIHKMKAQQRTLLESIQQNYNNEQYLSVPTTSGLYMSETGTCQQVFLEKLINIYVLRKKEYNKIDQERVQKLMKENSGSFTDLLLGLRFMAYCMENKIEVSYQKFGMLKLLTNWMDILERIKNEQRVNLCTSVFGAIHPENHTISSVEELIVYANYIAVDLQSILQRPVPKLPQGTNQSASEIQSSPQKPEVSYNHLEVEDMLLFLNNLIPKTLFNVVIPEPLIAGRPMTSTNPMDEKQKDFLYSFKSVEYFAKEKSHYQHLTKLLIITLLKFDLSQSQQKNLMLIGMKYFYLFNRNKLQEPFSIWTKIFEKITEAVRFALSDELILFFRVIKKLGHSKFIEFLKQKYEFIDELHKKTDSNGVIGYPKDALNVFHSLAVMQHVFVSPGTKTQRFIQIMQPYSLLYFYIGVRSLDINIKFYYMGQFISPVQKKQLLLNKEKCQLEFKGNIIAIEKGIYMFEFDNSYSWMKGKSLYYDTVVLTPLQTTKSGVEREKFLSVLFNKYEMNSCPENTLIDINSLIMQSNNMGQSTYALSNQSHDGIGQSQMNPQQQRGSVYIQQNQSPKKFFITTHYDASSKTYNLKSVAENKIYEYESQNCELFNKKANEILETLQGSKESTYEWYLDGKYELSGGKEMLRGWCEEPVGFGQKVEEKSSYQGQSQSLPRGDLRMIGQTTMNAIGQVPSETNMQSNQLLANEQITQLVKEVSQQQHAKQLKQQELQKQEQQFSQVQQTQNSNLEYVPQQKKVPQHEQIRYQPQQQKPQQTPYQQPSQKEAQEQPTQPALQQNYPTLIDAQPQLPSITTQDPQRTNSAEQYEKHEESSQQQQILEQQEQEKQQPQEQGQQKQDQGQNQQKLESIPVDQQLHAEENEQGDATTIKMEKQELGSTN